MVLLKKKPAEVISAGNKFARSWPHSQLLAEVFQLQMDAYRSLNDTTDSIKAGQRALKIAPRNVQVMAALAYILADGTTSRQRLLLAQHYAQKALTTLKTFRVPKRISPREWNKIQRRVQSEVHATLGLVAYKNGDTASAIREFQISVNLAPTPNPAQYYQLGLLYEATGKKTNAIKMFERATSLTDSAIRDLAETHLKRLQR